MRALPACAFQCLELFLDIRMQLGLVAVPAPDAVGVVANVAIGLEIELREAGAAFGVAPISEVAVPQVKEIAFDVGNAIADLGGKSFRPFEIVTVLGGVQRNRAGDVEMAPAGGGEDQLVGIAENVGVIEAAAFFEK